MKQTISIILIIGLFIPGNAQVKLFVKEFSLSTQKFDPLKLQVYSENQLEVFFIKEVYNSQGKLLFRMESQAIQTVSNYQSLNSQSLQILKRNFFDGKIEKLVLEFGTFPTGNYKICLQVRSVMSNRLGDEICDHVEVKPDDYIPEKSPIHGRASLEYIYNSSNKEYNDYPARGYQLNLQPEYVIKGIPFGLDVFLTNVKSPYRPSPNTISLRFNQQNFRDQLAQKFQRDFDLDQRRQEIEKAEDLSNYRKSTQIINLLENDTLKSRITKIEDYKKWLSGYDETIIQKEIDQINKNQIKELRSVVFPDSLLNTEFIESLIIHQLLADYQDSSWLAEDIRGLSFTKGSKYRQQQIQEIQYKLTSNIEEKLIPEMDSIKTHHGTELSPSLDSVKALKKRLEHLSVVLHCLELKDYSCLLTHSRINGLNHNGMTMSNLLLEPDHGNMLQQSLENMAYNATVLDDREKLDSLKGRLASIRHLKSQIPYLEAQKREWADLQKREAYIRHLQSSALQTFDLNLLDTLDFHSLDWDDQSNWSPSVKNRVKLSGFQQIFLKMEEIDIGSSYPYFSPLIFRGSQLNGLHLKYKANSRTNISLASGQMHKTLFGESIATGFTIESQYVNSLKMDYTLFEGIHVYLISGASKLAGNNWDPVFGAGTQIRKGRFDLNVDLSSPIFSRTANNEAHHFNARLDIIPDFWQIEADRISIGSEYKQYGNFAYQSSYEVQSLRTVIRPWTFLSLGGEYLVDNSLSGSDQSLTHYSGNLDIRLVNLPSLSFEYGKFGLSSSSASNSQNRLLSFRTRYSKMIKSVELSGSVNVTQNRQRLFEGQVALLKTWDANVTMGLVSFIQLGISYLESLSIIEENTHHVHSIDFNLSLKASQRIQFSGRIGRYQQKEGWQGLRGGYNVSLLINDAFSLSSYLNYDMFYQYQFDPDIKPFMQSGLQLNYQW